MVFGGKFRIRRCNSKASYLPRQSLEKLNNTDPDHGSYKLTLTSNEDLVAHTKPSSYDILAHNNGKITNNLPDVLPLGAKLQPQPVSPTTANGAQLRYGSNNNLNNCASAATQHSPNNKQQPNITSYPMYSSQQQQQQQQHHRYSTPTKMNSFNGGGGVGGGSTHHLPPSYNRSQSYDVNNKNTASPTKFMSQSTIDLKKSHSLETTLEEPPHNELNCRALSPAQSENNLSSCPTPKSSSAATTPIKSLNVVNKFLQRTTDMSEKMSRPDDRAEVVEGKIFRAELVNATLSNAPSSCAAHKAVTRKDSLRENIEKITQLQSQLMSAHLSDSGGGLLSGCYSGVKSPLSPTTTKQGVQLLASEHEAYSHTAKEVDVLEQSIGNASESAEVRPSLPKSPPPLSPTSSASSDAKAILAQISQMDHNTDGLKLMQRSEIILHVHPMTMEAASQTDDLLDCDIGRLTMHHAKEDAQTRITLQPRERHPIEIDCDKIAKELANLLPANDKLIELLMPLTPKTAADYIDNLYNPNVPLRPTKHDVGTSTLMRMKLRESQESSSAERHVVAVELQYAEIEMSLPNGNDYDSGDLLKTKVNELMKHLDRKMRILNKEQTTIREEAEINDERGAVLLTKFAEQVRPLEATKFRTFIDDVGHITSLLLSLSERLARAENVLIGIAESGGAAEQKSLDSKRERLLEQLEEAKRLKEDIDRRGASVTVMLKKNLNNDEFADFDYFINMKAKLITDARDIADKIKSGEEQLLALSEVLRQSEC